MRCTEFGVVRRLLTEFGRGLLRCAPLHAMGKAKAGEGYCPQCKRSGLLVHTRRATGAVYCDDWKCQRAAGVPSVARPPKRAKKEEEPQPPVELGAAAAATVGGAAAAAAAEIDAADEGAALLAEQASLAALMEQLAGAFGHAKARHEHITRLLAARRDASAAAEAAVPLSGLEAAAAAAEPAAAAAAGGDRRIAVLPFVAPEDAPPSVARQYAAWGAHVAGGGSARSLVYDSSAAPAAAAAEPPPAVEAALPAVETAPAHPPAAACEADAAPALAPIGGRRRARHDTVTIQNLGPDGASPASSASGTPFARTGLRSSGRM